MGELRDTNALNLTTRKSGLIVAFLLLAPTVQPRVAQGCESSSYPGKTP
jgi:hypothetical protein